MNNKVTTWEAIPTEEQAARMMNRGRGIIGVYVDGERVGTIGKNKHGMWLGNFDREAFDAPNPFSAARMSHTVRPAGRPFGTTKKDIVAAVAAQEVGVYARYLSDAATAAGQRREATA